MHLLIVTNHETHEAYDSVYAIAHAFASTCPDFKVSVASTAVSSDHFEMKTSIVRSFVVDDTFQYVNRRSFFQNNKSTEHEASSFDAVFFRIDRVIENPSSLYDYFDYFGKIAPNVCYVNSPRGLISTSSKAFLTHFRSLCADFEIIDNTKDLFRLVDEHPIVLKPLGGYGGSGIIRVNSPTDISVEGENIRGDEALKFINHQVVKEFPLMAMKYLKNVSLGDKRIVVVAGECLGAVLRTPKKGSWMANLAQGASSTPSEPDDDELRMIEVIDPIMQQNGITVYGIDTITDDSGTRVLSEINTTNVGGFVQIEKTTGLPILDRTAALIANRLRH